MSIKSGRKLGFWSALAMLIGSVVGIGIFFKNGSVLRDAGQNGATALLAWIIGGLVSLFAAISYSEIGSLKTKNVHGLAAWAEVAGGPKLGYFIRFNYSMFFSLLPTVFGVFVSEAFFQILISAGSINKSPDIYVHVIVGLTLGTIALVVNYISTITGGVIAQITTAIKFIPLVASIIIGLAFAGSHVKQDSSVGPIESFNGFQHGSFSFNGLIAALPAVLFSYDAFLNVGTLSEKTKGGAKTISKAVLIGMITITTLYTLIAASSILHSPGVIEVVINDAVNSPTAHKTIKVFMWLFITVSAYGVQNGIAITLVNQVQQSVQTNTIFGVKTLRSKLGDVKTMFLIVAILTAFWTLVILVPAAANNNDGIIDTFTNFPSLFFFGVYALVIGLYWRQREKMATSKINNILFKLGSALSIICIILILGWQIFFTLTIQTFGNLHGDSHAGFFAGNGKPFDNISRFIVLIVSFMLFVGLPFINKILTWKWENNNVIIHTQN